MQILFLIAKEDGESGKRPIFFFPRFLMHKGVLIHFNSRFSQTAMCSVSQTGEKDSLRSYLMKNIAAETFLSAL